ncbi:hypothetical protein O9929_20255 [Vibrio lentus]|nr:hypothetical protein [Vibrio lentus]
MSFLFRDLNRVSAALWEEIASGERDLYSTSLSLRATTRLVSLLNFNRFVATCNYGYQAKRSVCCIGNQASQTASQAEEQSPQLRKQDEINMVANKYAT